MDLISLRLTGGPVQRLVEDTTTFDGPFGVLGVDVAGRAIDGRRWTVVQLLLDDDHPHFDQTLHDAPVVAEVRRAGSDGTDGADGADGDRPTLALEPFDHDRFRRQLEEEQAAGESTTRGVLVRTGGQLPPPYVRLAFLPIDLEATAGADLLVRRTSVAELVAGVEAAHAAGEVTDDGRRALLVTIEQRHPTPEA